MNSPASLVTEPRRTDPRSFVVQAIAALRLGLVPAVALIVSRSGDDEFVAIASAMAIAGIAISAVFSFIAWWQTTYVVADGEIRVTRNLLSRHVRSVPYDRIQDVALTQTALPRLFGLVALTFETGAGEGDDLTLSYLSLAEGERLRAGVRDRSGHVSSGQAAESEEDHPPLYAMSPRRVLLLGLFNFSLVIFGAAAAFIAQYDEFLPFDPWDVEDWERRLAGPGAWLAQLGLLAQVIGLAGLLVILALLGVATGIVRTALREWGFRLDRTPRGLRRRRGLVSRTDVTVPVRRVQAVVRGTGAVRRRWGWYDLSLVSLAGDAGAAHHQIAPLATRGEVLALGQEVGVDTAGDGGGWHRLSPAAAYAAGAGRIAVWLFFALVAIASQRLSAAGGFLGGPLPVVLLVAIGLWRSLRLTASMLLTRYRIDREFYHVRTGWLAPLLIIGWREKLQTVEVSRSPLARRLGYADLTVGIAGMPLTLRGIEHTAAQRLRRDLLEAMGRRDFSAVN